jgi:hypothetical protein
MDQGERANFECLALTCRLPENLSISAVTILEGADVSTCSHRLPSAVIVLALGQTQNYFTVFNKMELTKRRIFI